MGRVVAYLQGKEKRAGIELMGLNGSRRFFPAGENGNVDVSGLGSGVYFAKAQGRKILIP